MYTVDYLFNFFIFMVYYPKTYHIA